MATCSVCYDGTLKFMDTGTEMVPPPAGTKALPLPTPVYYYKCPVCGSTYKESSNGSLTLVKATPYFEDLVWSYLNTPTPELLSRVAKYGGITIATLLRVLVGWFQANGKDRRDLLRSGKTTVDQEIGRIGEKVLDPCDDLLLRLDESARLRLCSALGDKEPKIQKVAALLLQCLRDPSDRVLDEVRSRLATKASHDASTALLMKAFLYDFPKWSSDRMPFEVEALIRPIAPADLDPKSASDRALFEREAASRNLEAGDLRDRAWKSAVLELSGWPGSVELQGSGTKREGSAQSQSSKLTTGWMIVLVLLLVSVGVFVVLRQAAEVRKGNAAATVQAAPVVTAQAATRVAQAATSVVRETVSMLVWNSSESPVWNSPAQVFD